MSFDFIETTYTPVDNYRVEVRIRECRPKFRGNNTDPADPSDFMFVEAYLFGENDEEKHFTNEDDFEQATNINWRTLL